MKTVQADRASAKRVAVFNNKGGVGKTTLTINIAAAVVALGKRVLLVDSDPQCNSSAYLVEESVVDDLLDHSDSDAGQTIWSALKPISEGTGDFKSISPIELRSGFYLLPGDVRLAEFEQELGTLWGECFQRKVRGFRGTSALSSLVNKIAINKKIDYVFYDSGPNIGALNRAILLDCDSYIVPVACDLFSLRAIKTLGQTLSSWIEGWGTITQIAPENTYILPGHPRLIGYIPQRFRVYRGLPSARYAPFISRIERAVQSDLAAVVKRLDPSLAPYNLSQSRIGDVKDFSSLANAAQEEGVAMFETQSGTEDQREAARDAFKSIATKLIERA